MISSLECTHWRWKNCPKAWAGQYAGKEKDPTVVLEVIADYDGWFWHLFFGMPGSCNDINVLDCSPLFSDLAGGRAPSVSYRINEHEYTMGYYLADGISCMGNAGPDSIKSANSEEEGEPSVKTPLYQDYIELTVVSVLSCCAGIRAEGR